MHRPGYVQGGQEAKCGYLLLGIYYRRIPGDIKVYVLNQLKNIFQITQNQLLFTTYTLVILLAQRRVSILV
jgi:hypothetical protein